jgi:hypothetical protein
MRDWFEFRESLDSGYRFTMKTDKDGDYSADVITDDGSKLRVIMYKTSPEEWHVGFARNSKGTVTGEGDALKIMTTVLDFTQKVIKKEKPKVVSFNSEGGRMSKGDDKGSRTKLYTRIANKYASKLGYRVTKKDYGYGDKVTEFNLVRK